jgi:hypothetical protein
MSNIREQWEESRKEDGFGTPITWRLSQQIEGDKAEREAFHAMMKLIAPALQDEAIRLWVKGTNGASQEAYNRRLLMSDLSDGDYRDTQAIAHEIWKDSLTKKEVVS